MDDSLQSVVDIKKRNHKKVADYLRIHRQATKKQVAEALNLSFATVSNICNQMEQSGLITGGAEETRGGVGRAPKSISLNPKARFILSADCHRSGQIALRLYDIVGEIEAQVDFFYDAASIGEFLDLFCEKYTCGFSPAQRARIVGVGVAVSGIYDTETGRIVASELELFEGQPLKEMLSRRLGVPVYIENESNLCAYGTAWREQTDDLVYFYIGEGLGIGIVSEGRKVVGQRGYACEICHAPLGVLEEPCRLCGNTHCMQTDVSIYGFAQKYTGERQTPGDHTGWEAFRAAFAREDPKALAAVEENARILAAGVSIVVNLFDPSVVVVGGLPAGIFERMRPCIQRVNRSRRVVATAPDTELLCDTDCHETVLWGAAEMAYSMWIPLEGDS